MVVECPEVVAYRSAAPKARGYEDSSAYLISRARVILQNNPITEAQNRALETFSGGGVGVGTHLDQKKLLWGA